MNVAKNSFASVDPALQPTSVGLFEIKVNGKATQVPSVALGGRTVIVMGTWVKIAKIWDEDFVEDEPVHDPAWFVSELEKTALNADILTFAQHLPDAAPRHSYYHEWDNFAVIPITTFQEWWTGVGHDIQKALRKANKSGIVVREVEFNDALVRGIQGIYNESSIRQGRRFWHYQKDFDSVKAENSTYADRNLFLGAYFEDELIGFVRLTFVGRIAQFLQILSQKKHQGKNPTNALIAKAIQVCEERGKTHLVYGNYIYQDSNSSLTEFKRRNGFQQILVPRYYIPLTRKGKLALALKLHHGIKEVLPKRLLRVLLKGRKWFNNSLITRLK